MNIKYPYHIPVPEYLGRAIKEVRRRKGLTQQDLADNTGTSAKFISDVERGKKTVQIDKVFDLIRALNLKIYITDSQLGKEEANGKTFDFLG